VIEYLLERLRFAGCSEIRVVTRPAKRDVVEHAGRAGVRVVEAEPPSLAASLRTGLEGLDDDAIVLFGLPDSIWEPEDGFVRVLAALDERTDAVLGLFRTSEPERSDVVVLAADGLVTAVDVKPARPRGNLIWGCGAARAGALAGLADHAEPGRYFDAVATAGRVRGVDLQADFIDIGTRAALARARSQLARR
jgi:glucose-1-phosphate thymidylyltransferase